MGGLVYSDYRTPVFIYVFGAFLAAATSLFFMSFYDCVDLNLLLLEGVCLQFSEFA
jgi:hypothetical protein